MADDPSKNEPHNRKHIGDTPQEPEEDTNIHNIQITSTVSSFSLPSTMPDVSQEPSSCAEAEITTSLSIPLPAGNPNNTPPGSFYTNEIKSFTPDDDDNHHTSAVNPETSDVIYNLDMDIGANEEILPEAAKLRNQLEIDAENVRPVQINLENAEKYINGENPIDGFFRRLQEDTEDIIMDPIGVFTEQDSQCNASLRRNDFPQPIELNQILPGVQEDEAHSRDVNAEMQAVNVEEGHNDLALIDDRMQDQLIQINNEMNERRQSLGEDINMRFLHNLVNEEINNVLRQREAALNPPRPDILNVPAEDREYDAASDASNNDPNGQARHAVNDFERVSSNVRENNNSSSDSGGRQLRKKPCKEKITFIPPPGNAALGNRWANALPDVVLVKLYQYMADNDRLNMAQVCKHWYNTFDAASLWRERYFSFARAHTNVKVTEQAIGYAKSHSNHLKNLTVICDSPTYSLFKMFQETMCIFFQHLLKRHHLCLLNELKLQIPPKSWRSEKTWKKFLKFLCRFLSSQKTLVSFEMSEAYFNAEDGFKVMAALGKGAGASLKTLNLEDFFQARLSLVSCHRWIGLITKFHTLSSLYINYCWISEAFLLALSQVCQTRLQDINIKVIKQDSQHHRIDGETWRTVRKRCPLLEVHLYTEGIGSHEAFRNLMPYELPLKSLTIWTGLHRPNEGPWHLSQTLTYIAHCFGQHLQEFSFTTKKNKKDELDESLINLLSKSRRLQYLDLQGRFQVSTIKSILRMQQQNQIGLRKCHVILENMTAIDLAYLGTTTATYTSMIEDRSLDFTFQPSELLFL